MIHPNYPEGPGELRQFPGGLAAALGLLFLAANVSLGDAVVGGCSVADLRSALAQGGTVTFAQDCAITFASPITVTNQVRLEANGHSVTLNGGGQSRLFIVEPGADLSLAGLTLTAGKAASGAGLYIKAGGAVTASNCVPNRRIRMRHRWLV